MRSHSLSAPIYIHIHMGVDDYIKKRRVIGEKKSQELHGPYPNRMGTDAYFQNFPDMPANFRPAFCILSPRNFRNCYKLRAKLNFHARRDSAGKQKPTRGTESQTRRNRKALRPTGSHTGAPGQIRSYFFLRVTGTILP